MAASDRDESDNAKPTARQLLHWATGDRDAEAGALADAAGEGVSEEGAEKAVKEAHGDLGIDDSATEDEEAGDDNDVASVSDAEQATRELDD